MLAIIGGPVGRKHCTWVKKPIILRKQVSTLLASAFRSYGSQKFEGKK
jgi:hypothetical protein